MASPMTETWWSNFLDLHGRDSEEEAAFLGYLTTQGIPPYGGPDVLQPAYEAFVAFVDESSERASADPGPNAADLAAQQARIAVATVAVPRSRTADPLVQKPLFAATRPKALRPSGEPASVPEFAEAQPMPAPQPIPGTPPRGEGVPGPQPPTEPPGPVEPQAEEGAERPYGQRRR